MLKIMNNTKDKLSIKRLYTDDKNFELCIINIIKILSEKVDENLRER